MKKWMNLLFVVFALLSMGVFAPPTVCAASANQGNPNVVDSAGLLTEEERVNLSSYMEEISNRQSCELVVVTIRPKERGGKSMMEYADDYFDYNGYGAGSSRSGVLLLISIDKEGHGDYWISTRGYGITALTDDGIQYIGSSFVPYLKDKEYADAFHDFAENCDTFITQAKNGEPYDGDNMPKGNFPWVKRTLISLAAGFVIALLIVLSMKAKLKTVSPAKSAANYVKQDSMHVTESRDMFLYANVTRTEIPKSEDSGGGGSSVHTSSSGSSHGGGGGSF